MVAIVRRAIGCWLLALLLALPACAADQREPGQPGGRVDSQARPAPALVIQPDHLDMGEVEEGTVAKATLIVRNVGRFPIHLARVEASCGCTTAEPATRDLRPGEFTALRVRVDTSGKRGRVRKRLTVTDAAGDRAMATLELTVRPNPHAAMKGRSIFDGQCARCHAEPARGKRRGAAIYAAVCAMCHGSEARGGYAPALRGLDADLVAATLRQGRGRPMPAFSRARGGPLDAAQIAAVAHWLSALDAGSLLRYKSAP